MAFNEVLRLVLDVDAAKGKRELDDFSKKTAANLTRIGSTMSRVGGTLTRQVTLPLVAIGAVATKMASDFDSSFVRMQTLAGVTAGEVDGMKESVLALAGETGRAPNELAEALFFLSSGGLDSAQAMDALEVSAKASAAGMGSTIQIADAVSSVMNAYARSGISAAEATDVLIATARAGKAEPVELAASLGRVLPVAAELGVTFQDVGAAVAALSLGGNDAAVSTTQLMNLLQKILRPSQQAREQLEGVGLSLEDLQDMVANGNLLPALEELRARLGDQGFADFLEDSQAVLAGLNLTGENVEQVREVFDELANSTGTLDNAFSTWAESMGAQNARAFGELQAAMIQFGEAIAPIVSDILGFVGDLASTFSDLPGPLQNIIVGVLAFAAALGPLLSVGGNVATFMGGMVKLTGSLGGALGSASLAIGGLAAVLGIAALTVFAFKQSQQEAEAVANDYAEAIAKGGQAAEVAADAITLEKFGEFATMMREAGSNTAVFAEEVRNGAGAASALRDEISQSGDMRATYVADLEAAAGAGNELAGELLNLVEVEDLSAQQIVDLLDKIRELSNRYNEGGGAAEDAAFSQEELAGAAEEAGLAFDEQGNLVEEATSALQDYADQLTAMFDPIFGLVDALQAQQEAMSTLREREAELAVAVRDYGEGSAEAQAAQEALTDAQIAASQSVVELNQAATALRFAVEEEGLSIEAARQRLVAMAIQQGFTAAEANALADQLGFAAGQADDLAGDYRVGIHATDNASRVVAGVLSQLNRIPQFVTTTLRLQQQGHITSGLQRQFGGLVEPGEIYRVGEVAPEWFVSDKAGKILTEPQMRRQARTWDYFGSPRMGTAAARIFATGQTIPLGHLFEDQALSHPALQAALNPGRAGMGSFARRPPGGGGGGVMMVENHFHFHGPVASQPDAERWVATAWNRAYDRNLINARGRRL